MMTQKIRIHDTILEEIHETRRKIAEKFNYDIAAISEDARKRQEASGRAIWRGATSKQSPKPTGNEPS